ncbi:FAD-binding protein [Streptomyces sp. SCSIO 30461]|uniref:FAD-binding protein n=1 Tax=Streptomyces sp. SCSIO 30461 TaxID=3118085 RepID=UPI0030CAEEB1
MGRTTQYDTVIIGGGPAGPTAALTLTRYRQRSLVIESPAPPRNAASRGVHGLIGLLEGATPDELRSRAWEELDRYGLATRLDATGDLTGRTWEQGAVPAVAAGADTIHFAHLA